MISNDILTGTAMLNAIWSQQHKDLLDLLLPFVQYSIGKNTKKDSMLSSPKLPHLWIKN